MAAKRKKTWKKPSVVALKAAHALLTPPPEYFQALEQIALVTQGLLKIEAQLNALVQALEAKNGKEG